MSSDNEADFDKGKKKSSSYREQTVAISIPSRQDLANSDFETFRKTDKAYNKIIQWFNWEQGGRTTGKGGHHWKERFIFGHWPSSPNGVDMPRTRSGGKNTGNGAWLWGSTLYDFYWVNSCPGVHSISTSSRIASWMKEAGQLDWAKSNLEQADKEDNPRRLMVYDMGEYLQVLEEAVWRGKVVGKPMDIDRSITEAGDQTLFAASEYPYPWPLRPFSAPLARLQWKFDLSELPRKLIVHDPWNALSMDSDRSESNPNEDRINRKEYKWGSKPDIIRTYHLQLSDVKHEKPPSSERTLMMMGGPHDCPLAHLYISPRRRIGQGHHSYVYQAELELPREMLTLPTTCFDCAFENISEENEGRSKMTPAELAEINGRRKTGNDLEFQYSYLDEEGKPLNERLHTLQGNLQNKPPFCKHLDKGVPIPPSHRVSVVAKLSLQDERIGGHEDHLRNEANNYEKFPSHMSEHWNGYNVIPPTHDPTPVGAVVPQYYGYYVPDKENDPIKSGKYMSPILLLEHCGVQVNPEKLSLDDRQECFSLIRRLHLAGYLHNSVFQRNILMQYGPLTDSPFDRSKMHKRFRLIDFGRTAPLNEDSCKAWGQQTEELKACNRNLELEEFI